MGVFKLALKKRPAVASMADPLQRQLQVVRKPSDSFQVPPTNPPLHLGRPPNANKDEDDNEGELDPRSTSRSQRWVFEKYIDQASDNEAIKLKKHISS